MMLKPISLVYSLFLLSGWASANDLRPLTLDAQEILGVSQMPGTGEESISLSVAPDLVGPRPETLPLAPMPVLTDQPPSVAAAVRAKPLEPALFVSKPASVVEKPVEEAVISPDPPTPLKPWVASDGSTLKTTIQEWAGAAGWVVHWNDQRPDLMVVGTIEMPGTFQDAAARIFEIYHQSGATYSVELYPKQKLLLVRNSI